MGVRELPRYGKCVKRRTEGGFPTFPGAAVEPGGAGTGNAVCPGVPLKAG
jgi:hypothetical protein